MSDPTHPLSSRRRFLQQTAALSLLGPSTAPRLLAQMEHMQSTMPARIAPNAPDSKHPMLHVLELPPSSTPSPSLTPPWAPPPPQAPHHHARDPGQSPPRRPPTRMWSYGPTPLGPVIEARSNQPVEITWVNNLPSKHFLPVDFSLHGSGRDLPEVRTVAHVHGAKVPTQYDGYPTDWFPSGQSKTCHYPLQQESATLWYHDHAMGLNRLNTYAGLTGLFLIRDQAEDALNLPPVPMKSPSSCATATSPPTASSSTPPPVTPIIPGSPSSPPTASLSTASFAPSSTSSPASTVFASSTVPTAASSASPSITTNP
ncbi:multicopper oxidase domain-containing protein [Tunturiibacter gelidiferens]|uniref:multicopper oxidase domain-containing protein n=1 Tax=Tunturiibacter gelidiferens TaxID=3069689 RepID=UPI003D9BCA2D